MGRRAGLSARRGGHAQPPALNPDSQGSEPWRTQKDTTEKQERGKLHLRAKRLANGSGWHSKMEIIKNCLLIYRNQILTSKPAFPAPLPHGRNYDVSF